MFKKTALILLLLFFSQGCALFRASKPKSPTHTFNPEKQKMLQKELMKSVFTGNLYQVRRALEAGAKVNFHEEIFGLTPLHVAVANRQEEIVSLLLENGAKVNARENNYGMTPLHFASALGNEKLALLLLEKGADPNLKTLKKYEREHVYPEGSTPMDMAKIAGKEEVIKILTRYREKKEKEGEETPSLS
jgi:ankyrin repeat protein